SGSRAPTPERCWLSRLCPAGRGSSAGGLLRALRRPGVGSVAPAPAATASQRRQALSFRCGKSGGLPPLSGVLLHTWHHEITPGFMQSVTVFARITSFTNLGPGMNLADGVILLI